MNFAHFILFTAYSGTLPLPHFDMHFMTITIVISGGLFAQDEMQVAECPSLGSVREALREKDPEQPELVGRTRSMDSDPTPGREHLPCSLPFFCPPNISHFL